MKDLALFVVIPVYNGYKRIRRSVVSANKVSRDDTDTYIIVVDDASTGTEQYEDILKDIELKPNVKLNIIHRIENAGAGVSRNTGQKYAYDILYSHNEYKDGWITFLDSDDLLGVDIFSAFDTDEYKKYNSISTQLSFSYEDKSKAIPDNPYFPSLQEPTVDYMFHGKLYNLNFMKKYNIKHDPVYRLYEDAYFNKLAWSYSKYDRNMKESGDSGIWYLYKVGYEYIDNDESTTKEYDCYLADTCELNVDHNMALYERYLGEIYTYDDYNTQANLFLVGSFFYKKTEACLARLFDSIKLVYGIENIDDMIKAINVYGIDENACIGDHIYDNHKHWLEAFNKYDLSIIIPCYKSEKWIRRTLTKLKEVLGDNLDRTQVILSDDNSPNDPEKFYYELKKEFPFITYLINKKNLMMGGNRNRGLRLAKGKWVAFLDHEDELTPEAMEAFNKYKDSDLCIFAGNNRNHRLVPGENDITGSEWAIYCVELIHGHFYNRKFLMDNNIYFSDKVKTSEDSHFNRKALLTAAYKYGRDKVVIDKDTDYYVWNLHEDSTFLSMYNDRKFDEEFFDEWIIAVEQVFEECKDFIPHDLYIAQYLRMVVIKLDQIYDFQNQSKNYKKENEKLTADLIKFASEKIGIDYKDLFKYIKSNEYLINEYFPYEMFKISYRGDTLRMIFNYLIKEYK